MWCVCAYQSRFYAACSKRKSQRISGVFSLVFRGSSIWCIATISISSISCLFLFFLFSLAIEDKVGDLLTEPDIESVQIVHNSARETSKVSSGPDSTIVDLLKTMQEQIIVSNKLLSGLVGDDQRLHSRKRKMSLLILMMRIWCIADP